MVGIIPKKTKFIKFQKKKIKNLATRFLNLDFGNFGLKAKKNGYITSKQLEMVKLNLSKSTKRIGQYWIRVFPHQAITAKPLEVRMGKGKGYIDDWVCKVKAGFVLCEVSGLPSNQARLLLKSIARKLPIQVYCICK
uniref:E9c7a147-c7a9-437f-85d1-f43a20fcb0c3-CDS n=1 Tax=Plasmodiophora brassicae TaxID=37360 RepID=A0A3P3YWA4_PLABS|nr:e9c7a147-c7a9-437f-85d1-f43a20fcb0c3-CDS [Plasmodiophora brassicae]